MISIAIPYNTVDDELYRSAKLALNFVVDTCPLATFVELLRTEHIEIHTNPVTGNYISRDFFPLMEELFTKITPNGSDDFIIKAFIKGVTNRNIVRSEEHERGSEMASELMDDGIVYYQLIEIRSGVYSAVPFRG